MVKIILESEDIEKLIKENYHTTSIEGLPKDLQITIKVDDIRKIVPKPRPQPHIPAVLTDDGNIDANASNMVNKNRRVTKPGGAMGQVRSSLPTF